MPTSDPASHHWMTKVVGAIAGRPGPMVRVLDCGVGVGLVARSLAEGLEPEALVDRRPLTCVNLVGLEQFAPYVIDLRVRRDLRYDYLHLYDSLILGRLGDFRRWLDKAPPDSQDIVIFGDSLEHVEPAEAEGALAAAIDVATHAVVVNAPIVELKQGPIHGNEGERHRVQWGREVWEALGGRFLGGDDVVGCFVWLRDSRPAPLPPRRCADQAGGSWFDAAGVMRLDPPGSPAHRPDGAARRVGGG